MRSCVGIVTTYRLVGCNRIRCCRTCDTLMISSDRCCLRRLADELTLLLSSFLSLSLSQLTTCIQRVIKSSGTHRLTFCGCGLVGLCGFTASDLEAARYHNTIISLLKCDWVIRSHMSHLSISSNTVGRTFAGRPQSYNWKHG